jgi:hypothetical protein
MKYNNYPFDVCATAAARLVEDGATVFQKFTCAKCGARQTMETPNRFFIEGDCGECHHRTDIRKTGCNYMVHALREYDEATKTETEAACRLWNL